MLNASTAEQATQTVVDDDAVATSTRLDVFLASLATCAGAYVLGFCRARDIPTEGVELVQRHYFEPTTHRLDRVELELVLPRAFPEKYRAAAVRAAEGCKVKKALASPPEIAVFARQTNAEASKPDAPG